MDDQQGIGLIEMRTVTNAGGTTTSHGHAPAPMVRFHLGDQLGSAFVELDGSFGVRSCEALHVYESTTWWAHWSTLSETSAAMALVGLTRFGGAVLATLASRFVPSSLNSGGTLAAADVGQYMNNGAAIGGVADAVVENIDRQIGSKDRIYPTRGEVTEGIAGVLLTPGAERQVEPLSGKHHWQGVAEGRYAIETSEVGTNRTLEQWVSQFETTKRFSGFHDTQTKRTDLMAGEDAGASAGQPSHGVKSRGGHRDGLVVMQRFTKVGATTGAGRYSRAHSG